MNLLIVESPAKAKTIQGYLSSLPEQWKVLATGGHIIDLPKSSHGILHEGNEFNPQWQIIEQKKAALKAIKGAAKIAAKCFIGSDDDREGEAIASTIIDYAKIKDPIRITFTEISKKSILQAIKEGARPLDNHRVQAQEARRLVDREIGYPVSQIIRWDFKQQKAEQMPKGVGRIISPALKLISDNSDVIEKFTPTPYHIIYADFNAEGLQFRLTHQHKFTSEQGHELDATLKHFQSNEHIIYDVKQRTREVTPYPPLVTSRLQRCAFYLYGLEPKQTMKIAQQLYEGVEVNGQRLGLISYPRTDSYSLSEETTQQIISILTEHYPSNYVLSMPREFSNKATAQAAHEAIHPINLQKEFYPKNIQQHLSKEQYEVYRLIWNRTLATQMTNAIYDNSTLEIDVAGNKLRAQANQMLFDGWEKLDGHEANLSERNEDENYKTREVRLPTLSIGESIKPLEISSIELLTKTPPRYGVGRFITVLDNKGIARPSTIDGIIPSLTNKGYIQTLKGMIYITELGKEVDGWVTTHAPWLNDVDKASEFEEQLDAIEKTEIKRDEIIRTYVEKVKQLQTDIGFVAADQREPTQDQLKYAMTLASSKGIELQPSTLMNQKLLSKFISDNAPKQSQMGKCPTCKGPVIETDKSYRCKDKSCEFYMVKSQVERFLNQFKIDADQTDFAKALFKRKKNGCEDLHGKEGKRFSAYVGLNKHEKFGWRPHIISFSKTIVDPVFRANRS